MAHGVPSLPREYNGRCTTSELFHDLIDAHKKRERSRYDPAPEVVKMAAWEWHAENRGRVLGSLNHEYIAAFERASARLIENGRMTPPHPETKAREWAVSLETHEKEYLERKAIEEAAIEVASVSDESPAMTIW